MQRRKRERPPKCTLCGSTSITKNRDGDFVCDDCGYVVQRAPVGDEEVDYLR